MRFKHIFLFLLLCLEWHLSQCETASPSTLTLTPLILASDSGGDKMPKKLIISNPQSDLSSAEVDKEMQKLSDFTDGLQALLEIYNDSYFKSHDDDNYDPTQIIGKNFKKAMDASRKCGMVMYEGLKYEELQKYYRSKNQENEELLRYKNISQTLGSALSTVCNDVDSAYGKYQKNAYTSVFERVMRYNFQQACRSFEYMLTFYFEKRRFDEFKEKCTSTWESGSFINYLDDFEYILESENFNDALLINCHILYKLILEFDMATYPMWRISNFGTPYDSLEKAQNFITNIRRVNQKFKELNYKRQYNYWSLKNIGEIVKKYILGENITDSSNDGENDKIADKIYKYLDENYKSLGYIYHVSVSAKTGRNGYNDTLIQCSTECKYIYNINGKDVYIIRNKKGQAYKECKFLPTSSLTNCGSDRDPRDLQELAKQIQQKCNPTAFSLIRSARGYNYATDYVKESQTPAFAKKCYGDISLTMANNY